MTCRKCSESSETVSSIQPDSQPPNAVCLKVFVNQLSQKQTCSIRSMYNFASVKMFSWLRHCICI